MAMGESLLYSVSKGEGNEEAATASLEVGTAVKVRQQSGPFKARAEIRQRQGGLRVTGTGNAVHRDLPSSQTLQTNYVGRFVF